MLKYDEEVRKMEAVKDILDSTEFWVAVVVFGHLVLVKVKGYEKLIFWLAGRSDLVRVFLELVFKILAEEKKSKVKDILKEVGLIYYILVEKWGERTGKKGDEKFERFMELLDEQLRRFKITKEEVKEDVKRFTEVVNYIQKNTQGEVFLKRADEVIKHITNNSKTVKVIGKVVRIILKFFGI